MARDVESLVLQMTADVRRFEKEMGKMRQTADRRLNEVEKRAFAADKRLAKVSGDMGRNMVRQFRDGLKGMAPVLAGAFSVAAVLRYADSYTSLTNQLRAAGLEGAKLKTVEDQLYETAARNGVAVSATAALYQRAVMARENLGATDEQLMRIVTGTTAALRLQGVSAQEASGPLLQLGQLLGGVTVQSQEFNSLVDGLPIILEAVAKGSDRWGGSVTKLSQEVKAGKVEVKDFAAALLNGLGQIEARAGQMPLTVGASFQVLNDALGRYIGQTDQGLSATERMSQGIIALADNLDLVITGAGVVVTVVGTRMVVAYGAGAVAAARLTAFQAAMTASMTGTSRAALLATGSINTLRAASVAFLATPMGAAILAIGSALAIMAIQAEASGKEVQSLTTATRRQAQAAGALKAEQEGLGEAITMSMVWVAQMTGETDKLADANWRAAAATKALALEQLNLQLQEAKATHKQNERAYARRRRTEVDRGAIQSRDRPLSGALVDAQGRVDQSQEARNLEMSGETVRALEANLAREMARELKEFVPTGGGGGATATGNGRGASGRAESAREMLELERAILEARASGDQAAIDAAEERLLLAQTIQKYERAGYADAEGAARQELAWLGQIAEGEERRAAASKLLTEYREADAKRAEEAARQAEERNRILLDELDLEAELARLRGDPAALAAAERKLFIERETNRLLEDRKDLTEAQARQQASDAYDSLRAAEIIGGLGTGNDPAESARAAFEELERLRADGLISERDYYAQRAQIAHDYDQARLRDTRSMLDAIATMQNSSVKELAAIGKAAAIAQATIDGYLAIQKAWASAPYPFNLPGVAITTASTAANVAAIAGMKDGGYVSGPGGPRDDAIPTMLSNGEFVNNAASVRANRPWLEAMNNGARFEDLAARVQGMANMTVAPRATGATRHNHHVSIDVRGAAGNKEVARIASEAAGEAYRQAIKDAPGAVHRAASFKLGGGGRRR